MKVKKRNFQMVEKIILVDENDNAIGTIDKLEAHLNGFLHRAISVFIFNDKGELLLQKRADNKYHSAGLWTNTCCSHPSPGESTLNAAIRRLDQEMKILTPLNFLCSFQYKSIFSNGLIENEIDHIFFGISNQLPNPDPQEASDWRYIKPDQLITDIEKSPDLYTSWLKICIDRKIFDDLVKSKNKHNDIH